MKMKLLLAIALLGLGVISIHGQNVLDQKIEKSNKIEVGVSYTDFMKDLEAGVNTAKIEGEKQFLLTADQTFSDGDKKLAIDAKVYLVKDETIKFLTHLTSSGTAYPIAWDGKGFYVAGGHCCYYYVLQDDELVVKAYVIESFDGNGQASYEVLSDGKKVQGTAKDFEVMFEHYLNAQPVNFK